jgi:uncharacterized membrane protein YhaH (DUF805 family)
VDRRTYFVTGVSLMLVKYALDATVVWLITRQFWSPLEYLVPSLNLRAPKGKLFPGWLIVAMVAWSVPFLSMGATMTLRRALDAGRSPWLVVLFFVPVVNYAVMLWLSVLPSRPTALGPRPEGLHPASLRVAGAAIVVVGALGVALAAFCALVLQGYGASLFLGTPFVMGMLSAFFLNRRDPTTTGATLRVAALTAALGGLALLLFALEGVLCIAMALPVAIPAAMLGAVLGRAVALRAPGTALHAVVVVLALPAVAALETASPPPPLREVVSVVEVNAPPAAVWRHVVAFSAIPERPAWFFRAGIAYPTRAMIDGAGVGALRRCEFSTGVFVEPITVWDAPRRLTFDVTAQPDAMRELSPYRSVRPPHLDGAFRAQRGEFRLMVLPGGRTRLEGSTWYTLDLAPGIYWQWWADALVHAIHDRVLVHVKRLSEADYSGSPRR